VAEDDAPLMSADSVIDDVAVARHLELVWKMTRTGRAIPLAWLSALVAGAASPADVERYGREWTTALCSMLTRAGIGAVVTERDELVFVPAPTLPATPGAAWDRVRRSWKPSSQI
jgi:hypothetical protein